MCGAFPLTSSASGKIGTIQTGHLPLLAILQTTMVFSTPFRRNFLFLWTPPKTPWPERADWRVCIVVFVDFLHFRSLRSGEVVACCWLHFPSGRYTSPVKPASALHVAGHVGQGDHGLRPLQADGADEQSHACRLLGEHMLHLRPNARHRMITAGHVCRYRLASRLPVVNVAAPAMPRWPPSNRPCPPAHPKPCWRNQSAPLAPPSCAASVTFIHRMMPWRRPMLTWFL